MAARATRATQALTKAGAAFRLHVYEVAEKVGEGYGEAVAEAIGMPGSRVFKTLVAFVDEEPVVAVIPVERRLAPKRMASALGGKHCSLASRRDAERFTGYVTGGISPFGQRKRMRLVLDESAADFETIAVSGGRRGVQLEVAPGVVIEVTGGTMAAVSDG